MTDKAKKEIKNELNPVSRAKQIRILLKMNKGLLKNKEDMVAFKEPVVMLMRRSRAVEFYHDASKGDFKFIHSDKKPRTIYLDPSMQLSFDYGKFKFRGYWCHEDYPTPLPQAPLVTAETMNLIVEKTMVGLNKLNQKDKELELRKWKGIVITIIIGIGIYFLWTKQIPQALIDKFFGTHLYQTVVDTGKTIVQNATANIDTLGVSANG